jgi:cytochrome P450
LAKHPEIQEKLYAEIVKIAPPSVEKIGVDHVDQMPYLNGFLQEVLRLYPPAGFFSRTNTGPETLGGVTIPAGTRLGISAHILQRHPKYWDDPNTFIPERWINVSEAEAERRRFAYFPFSAGGRSCIGARFATCEAQLIVAALVRAFRIEIAPSQKDTEHTFTTRITMKAKPAISIVVHKRS